MDRLSSSLLLVVLPEWTQEEPTETEIDRDEFYSNELSMNESFDASSDSNGSDRSSRNETNERTSRDEEIFVHSHGVRLFQSKWNIHSGIRDRIERLSRSLETKKKTSSRVETTEDVRSPWQVRYSSAFDWPPVVWVTTVESLLSSSVLRPD